MPPIEVKKMSIRLQPQAIAIVEAYAASHKCSQTEAINAIILASCHPLVPPISATQLDDQWQRSIEDRLAKLEVSATQMPSTFATQNCIENSIGVFTEGFITATQVPPIFATHDTTKPLTNAEFKQWLGLGNTDKDNCAFSKVCEQGRRDEGYLADDGSLWKVKGKAIKAVWTKTAALVEAIA